MYGLEVVVNDAITAFEVPVRKHIRKRWMSAQYHRRVQKKWTKRWGTRVEFRSFAVGDAFIVHSKVAAVLKTMDVVDRFNCAGHFPNALYEAFTALLGEAAS